VKRIDSKIKKGLFLFAVSNSCMDPIVYGMFISILMYMLSKILTKICSMSAIFRTRTSTTQYIKLHRNKEGMSQPCQRLLTATEYVCQFSQ